jgi:hypothetical protein
MQEKACREYIRRIDAAQLQGKASLGMVVGLVVTIAASYSIYSLVAVPCILSAPAVEMAFRENSFLRGLVRLGVPVTAGVLSLSPLLHALHLIKTSFLPRAEDVRFPRMRFWWTFAFCVYVSLATIVALFYPLASLTDNPLTKKIEAAPWTKGGGIADGVADLPVSLGSREQIESVAHVTLRCAVGQVGLLVTNMYLIVRLMLGFTLATGLMARLIRCVLLVAVPVTGQMAGMTLASRALHSLRERDPPTAEELKADMKSLSSKLDQYSSRLD